MIAGVIESCRLIIQGYAYVTKIVGESLDCRVSIFADIFYGSILKKI